MPFFVIIGRSPLHCAIYSHKRPMKGCSSGTIDSLRTIQELVRAGADLNQPVRSLQCIILFCSTVLRHAD